MFENFGEYMWYLLTTPFKKIKKSINAWYALCRVFGRRFDEVKEDLLRARDEGMVASCSHEMLAVHGADRGISRYAGEDMENFRSRIATYEEVCKLGGTNEGVLLAVRTLGYDAPELVRANDLYLPEDEAGSRWAEFYVLITLSADGEFPISFNILQSTVRKWKEVGAKDNYLFILQVKEPTVEIADGCRMVLGLEAGNGVSGESRVACLMDAENRLDTGLVVEIKNNLFYLDGVYRLDGTKTLNTYEKVEEA